MELQASELRIGNIVNYGDSDLIIDINVLWDIDFYKLKPIPLTEEWLVKFGFEKKDNGMIFEFNNYSHSFLWFNKTSGQLRLVDEGMHFLTHDELKHVHQLQNLYWCLVGEELIVK